MLNSRGVPICRWLFVLVVAVMSCPVVASAAEAAAGTAPTHPWWFWPVILFFFCLVLGVLAAAVLLVGIWPAPLVDLMHASVDALLQHIQQPKIVLVGG